MSPTQRWLPGLNLFVEPNDLVMMETLSACPLCKPDGELIVWQDDLCRVILVEDADHSGYCRIIWKAHEAEMTDLSPGARAHLMHVVMATESALRSLMQPDKINLASMGNRVPHLHWHVIARFRDDAHFPDSIWSQRLRTSHPHKRPSVEALRTELACQLTNGQAYIAHREQR